MVRLPAILGVIALAIVLPIGGLVGQPSVSQPPDQRGNAVATVETLHQALLAVMREANVLGFPGRRERLAPVVASSFDFPTISATVVGGMQWRALTDAQRSTMERTFRELTLATYADRFTGYSDERFQTIVQRPLRSGRTLVRTELVVPDAEPVRLDYVLHRVDDAWRIVNILADGVSDLSVKRAEYSSILRTGGFDLLIARLEEQIVELTAD